MERPIFKPLGTEALSLDTPALVVDISALEHNIETVHSFFARRKAKVRPHVEAHRCPAIAHRQLAVEGTVGGIAVNTVGQAEAFANAGFRDIFISSQVATRQKMSRLCSLAHYISIAVAVDCLAVVQGLSGAASAAGVKLRVFVDINTSQNRGGVEPGKPALDLAKPVAKAPGLDFAGLMTYEGPIFEKSPDRLAQETRKRVQKVLDTREMIEKAGIEVGAVAAGGTHNYEIVGAMAGITEVHPGSYALMDYRYARHRPQLRLAARVLATVTSRPEKGLAITDTGQKAIGADSGFPVVESLPDAQITLMAAEHGFVKLGEVADRSLKTGDKIWLIPRDIGTCANLYDYIHLVRDGRLEAVWNVSARGLYR